MKTIERLQQLRGSRSVTEWEKSAGIARGNLDRALKTGKLSDANLRKLCKVENVRSDWLLFGQGMPYQTAVFQTDYELSEKLCAHHIDEADSWILTLVLRQSDRVPVCVVLHMPGEFPVSTSEQAINRVRYTIIEILTGPLGRYCRAYR